MVILCLSNEDLLTLFDRNPKLFHNNLPNKSHPLVAFFMQSLQYNTLAESLYEKWIQLKRPEQFVQVFCWIANCFTQEINKKLESDLVPLAQLHRKEFELYKRRDRHK